MNDRQENKLTRNKAVDKFLDDNAAVISAIPLFVSSANGLKMNIAATDGYVQVQIQNITGTTEDKQKFRNAAISNVMVLVGPMKAWALSNNDNTFFEVVDYSKSKLEKLRDTVLDNALTMLNTKANDNIGPLAVVGLTATEVSASVTSTASYLSIVTAPRNAIGVRANATALIKVSLKEADVIIEQIRNLNELFRLTNVTFYNELKSALEIVDTGSKSGGGNGGGGGGGNVLMDEVVDILPNSYLNIDTPDNYTLKGTNRMVVTITPMHQSLQFGFGPDENSIAAPLPANNGETTTSLLSAAGLSGTNKFLNLFNPSDQASSFHLQLYKV